MSTEAGLRDWLSAYIRGFGSGQAGPSPRTPRRWPELRAVLIALHVLAMLVLTLPGGYIRSRNAWNSANVKADFAAWTAILRRLGVETTPERFEATLWSVATEYVEARSRV